MAAGLRSWIRVACAAETPPTRTRIGQREVTGLVAEQGPGEARPSLEMHSRLSSLHLVLFRGGENTPRRARCRCAGSCPRAGRPQPTGGRSPRARRLRLLRGPGGPRGWKTTPLSASLFSGMWDLRGLETALVGGDVRALQILEGVADAWQAMGLPEEGRRSPPLWPFAQGPLWLLPPSGRSGGSEQASAWVLSQPPGQWGLAWDGGLASDGDTWHLRCHEHDGRSHPRGRMPARRS